MLGVGHHSRWLQKQAAIRVFAHHEALVGTAGEDCAAAVIRFDHCKFGHHLSIAHFPTMGIWEWVDGPGSYEATEDSSGMTYLPTGSQIRMTAQIMVSITAMGMKAVTGARMMRNLKCGSA